MVYLLHCLLRGSGVLKLQVVQRPQQRLAGLLVQKTSQRVVVIVHRKLHAGTKAGGAVQRKVGVYVQKQQAVLLQQKAVDRLEADALVRDGKVGDAAGQLAGVQTDGACVLRQDKGDRDLVGQFVVDILGGSQAFPGRKAAAGVVEQLRQGKGDILSLGAVLGKLGLASQQLLLQLQTPLRQLGNTLVRKLELLLQLGNC